MERKNSKDLEVNETKIGATMTLHLKGVVSENATLTVPHIKGIDLLKVNLHELRSINSIGLRQFCSWLTEISVSRPELPISLERLSPILVYQIGSVLMNLPVQVTVESIHVPFFCESCGLENHEMLLEAANYQSGMTEQQLEDSPPACTSCKGSTILDVTSNRFFKILESPLKS